MVCGYDCVSGSGCGCGCGCDCGYVVCLLRLLGSRSKSLELQQTAQLKNQTVINYKKLENSKNDFVFGVFVVCGLLFVCLLLVVCCLMFVVCCLLFGVVFLMFVCCILLFVCFVRVLFDVI